MTGFAQREGAVEAGRWVWEIRSVNGRSLDLKVRLAPGFEALEATVRATMQKAVSRGSIFATLTIRRDTPSADVRLNVPLLDKLLEELTEIANRTGAPPPRVESLLSVRGVLETGEPPREADEELARAALSGLDDALAALVAARRSEGRQLAGVLNAQLDDITALSAAARIAQTGRAERIRARLATAVQALFEASDMLDPTRLHQEAVLIASKADIQEEIDRLEAHVASARTLLAAGEPVGRRLDFLSQELNREANTLCSKANDAELTEVGLRLKAAIEQFREQVQNIE